MKQERHMPPTKPSNVTLKLVMVDDKNGNGQPNFGDTIRFDVSPPDTQWDQLVMTAFQPAGAAQDAQQPLVNWFQSHVYAQPLILSGGGWTSGAADLLVRLLRYGRNTPDVIAELKVTAAA